MNENLEAREEDETRGKLLGWARPGDETVMSLYEAVTTILIPKYAQILRKNCSDLLDTLKKELGNGTILFIVEKQSAEQMDIRTTADPCSAWFLKHYLTKQGVGLQERKETEDQQREEAEEDEVIVKRKD